ncbi:MAG: GAF domain-containing protein [Actinobacteria bacterium]|nr:GAF domain-containing protein [Actinomycetota bacterium]
MGTDVAVPNTRPDASGANRTAAGVDDYNGVVDAFCKLAIGLDEDVELDAVLHLVARNLVALLGVRRCSVYLRDADSELFHGQVAETGVDEDEDIKRLTCGTAGDRFTQEIVATGEPVLIANAQHDHRPIRATMRNWGVRSMLGVPIKIGSTVVGLLFLDDGSDAHEFTADELAVASEFAALAAIPIIQARHAAKVRQSLESAVRRNSLLRRCKALDDELTELLLGSGGLSDIATTVARSIGKPAAIYDAEFRQLAAAMPNETADPPARFFDPGLRQVPEVEAGCAAAAAKRPAVVGPVSSGALVCHYLIEPVASATTTFGYIVLADRGSRFGALDRVVARRAATVAAFEFTTKGRSGDGERQLREALLRDLINGTADPQHSSRRAEFAGLHLSGRYAICLLRPRGEDATPPAQESVEAAFDAAGVDYWPGGCTIEGGATVIVGELDDRLSPRLAKKHFKQRVRDAVTRLDPAEGTACAISTVLSSAEEFHRGHREARQVMRCLLRIDADRATVMTADDLGPGRLFLATAYEAEIDRFVDDALGPLISDNALGPAPLETLEVFFETGRSVRLTALDLDVHENTVRYRLGRVTKFTNLNVAADAEDQLTVQIALVALRLRDPARMSGPA